MPRSRVTQTPEIQVSADGVPDSAVDYARDKVGSVLRFADQPVLYVRIRLTKHGNPAMERPVVAQANLDVNGRLVRAQVTAPTTTEAVDELEDRLRRRLKRVAENWQARRGRTYARDPLEWRPGDLPSEHQPFLPLPREERQVIRRKSFTLPRCTLDEAAREMDDLDYDFHLFTEQGSGQDSVTYRAGPTGYRVAQVDPDGGPVSKGEAPVTVSELPPPTLRLDEAVERLDLSGMPFVFYRDPDTGRGRLLYHRYDGHYGLITPAA